MHRQGLRRYLRRRLVDRDDVEDILQEVFCRVLEDGRFLEVENPGAYLFSTARHIVIDRYRRDRVRAGAHGTDPSSTDMHGGYLVSGEMEAAYEEALLQLPAKCREVFLLRRHDGLTNSEVALELGISVRMVQKHMVRALIHFYKRLR